MSNILKFNPKYKPLSYDMKVIGETIIDFIVFIGIDRDYNQLPIEFKTPDQFITYHVNRFLNERGLNGNEKYFKILYVECLNDKMFRRKMKRILRDA